MISEIKHNLYQTCLPEDGVYGWTGLSKNKEKTMKINHLFVPNDAIANHNLPEPSVCQTTDSAGTAS